MATEDTLSQTNICIYFVVRDKHESEEDCNENMWDAYNLCVQNEFQPQWIDEKRCHAMKAQKSDVFVMEEFEGELFEKLKNYKCSIVGPRCLISCFLSGEPIPDGTNTIFTTAMRGMIISASGFPANVKENIQKKIEYMGGIFMKSFRACVTHLVSDSVGSIKYEKAVEQGIPVMTDKWIDAIWEANLQEFVKADDPSFDMYKCPVFMNVIVTSTNLPKRQKEEVKKLINSHGGTFMGVLDGSKVKIVLAPQNSALSEKLKYAKHNNIDCLDVEWVYKSVSAGYALPFTDYRIKSTKSTSTPEKLKAHETLNISTISVIPGDYRHNGNVVDETMTTTISTTINSCTLGETPTDRQALAPYAAVLDKLDVRQAKLAGPFLDGCNIYLAGFPTNHRDKINRILNAGGATRLDDMSDALTHVLVGDPVKASSELKLMKSKGLSPYILSLDWLEESLKLKRPASEENYANDKKQSSNAKPAEPPSPLSKKNIQMLQRVKRPPPPQFDIDKEVSSRKPDDGEEEASLMKQYLQEATGDNLAAERSFQEFLQPHNSTANEITVSRNSKNLGKSFNTSKAYAEAEKSMTAANRSANDSAIPLSQSTITDKMFEGLTFLVTGFDPEESSIVLQNIKALGGKLVSNSFVGVPDFGVVPLTGATLKHGVDEIVTDLFIEDCIDQENLVELKYYHRPLSISATAKPLEGCVMATSTYAGIERSYLSKVAVALGARYQDTFARKTNPEKSHIGSTHLLCPSPEGSKYNAAVKWKLPAVTSDWLRACAAKMRLVDETPYLVGETIAPERPEAPADASYMGPPAAVTTPRTILTPKRHLQNVQAQVTPSFATPLINKRLGIGGTNTPRSSYDIPTPETPYGAIFNPNPSPETRKEWVRWIDNFPDLRRDEPPPKRRAPSTPLSELRRQFWKIVTEPIPPKDANGHPTDDEVFKSGSPAVPRSSTRNAHSVLNTGEEHTEEGAATPDTPINRKLSFTDNSPAQKKQIELQIEQLDQVLQATSSTTESRYSLSGNAKIYNQDSIERIDKCMVKESQPDTVGWEDPAHSIRVPYNSAETVEEPPFHQAETAEEPIVEEDPIADEEPPEKVPQKRKFMLSGIKDRASYETVIRKFGGEVSTETIFDPSATHLLCIRPSRNEKSLASIAAGKWVLHCTYLRDCELEGHFIDEEKYEWGNPLSEGVIPEPSGDTEKSIAAAAYRWRLKLQKSPGGAFSDMVAILLVPSGKYEQFERLIKAGGGAVVQAKPPYDSSPNGRKITHCFIQLNKLDQPVDWAMLASKGILCFHPPFLSEYLTAETPPNNRDSVIPEFKKYLSLLPK